MNGKGLRRRHFWWRMAMLYTMSMIGSVSTAQEIKGSIYDFKMNSLDGKLIDFNQYRGKYLLIVNTASKCGYTPQYADLEKLEKQFGDKVTILGFPANNFLWQEPGSNAEIATFCEKNYGVTFQMFAKVSVKGRHADPLYKWLAARTGSTPSWNFCKYLFDKSGNFLAFYPSKVNPLDPQILSQLK
jgi:glutathione peroxidase